MTYLLLCVWGACVFFAFQGYGKLALRVFRVHDAPWALSASIGVALAVAAGGVLNLLHLVTPPVLIAIVIGGVLLALLVEREHLASSWIALLGTSIPFAPLIILTAIPVIGNVHPEIGTFNPNDDLSSYLTLPEETLQTGSLPYDPFNERRIITSLGAPYVLQSLMLVAGDVRSIRCVDVSLGLVLYAGLLVAIFRTMGLSIFIRMCLACLAVLVPLDRLNATMVALPAALFCTLFLLQIHPGLGGRASWRRAVLLGLTAAALGCLKSNYLPAAVLICAFYYLALFAYRKRTGWLLQGLLCIGVLLFCMLPWMIDMRQKEGTALFPILGRGYDASAYGIVPLPSGAQDRIGFGSRWMWLTVLLMIGPLAAGFMGLAIAFRKRVESAWVAPLSALLAGSAVSIGAVAYSTGGEAVERYSMPFEVPALIILGGFLFSCRNSLRRSPRWLLVSGAPAALALIGLGYASGFRHGAYRRYLEDVRLVTPPRNSWFDSKHEENRIRNLQSHIPPGERLLARLFVTYPFDFKRNQIFVADFPGMAGLPPGMPLDGRPAELQRYLLAHGIRYLAYDPRRTHLPDSDPGTSLSAVLHGQKDYGRHAWPYIQLKVANVVQYTFAELAESSLHIYDDGEVYVLDLKTADYRRRTTPL
jgi:hypothetical protein